MIRLNGRLIKKIVLYGAVIFAVVLLLSQFHSPIHIQVLSLSLSLSVLLSVLINSNCLIENRTVPGGSKTNLLWKQS